MFQFSSKNEKHCNVIFSFFYLSKSLGMFQFSRTNNGIILKVSPMETLKSI